MKSRVVRTGKLLAVSTARHLHHHRLRVPEFANCAKYAYRDWCKRHDWLPRGALA
jgi:hypothetical protein